jgi:fructosamine-3-kinase
MNHIDRASFQDIVHAEILSCDLLTQGQIGPIYTLQTSTGKYLLKTSESSDRLMTEARMLKDMAASDITVPEVYDAGEGHLLMAFIEESTMDLQQQERAAAKLVAQLHSVTNDSRMYGYWYDTTIGPFPQNNEQTQYNWTLFLGQMRIMPMARICYDKGVLPKETVQRLELLCRDMYRRIDMSKIQPSLIHGDLWSGNILFNMNNVFLIDPALYFADREMELAFLRMFRTFGETFWSEYKKYASLSEDFDTVKVPLYQIYPYLVHMALYGSSYLRGLQQCLKDLKV